MRYTICMGVFLDQFLEELKDIAHIGPRKKRVQSGKNIEIPNQEELPEDIEKNRE